MSAGTPLSGRVAVVTGASSGIGRALAVALAGRGVRLVLGARDAAALERLGEELAARGAEVATLPRDLREDGAPAELVDTALSVHGRLDVMINNAGVAYPGPVLEGSTAHWRELLETNALAVFVGCREAARVMEPGAVLVNISSTAGATPTPGDAVYCASKHAVHAFSAALRAELRERGVHVLVVEAGQTMTSIGRGLPPGRLAELAGALGIDPARIPDYQGRHAPADFVESVLREHPARFLDPEQVSGALLDALSTPPIPELLRILPGVPPEVRRVLEVGL